MLCSQILDAAFNKEVGENPTQSRYCIQLSNPIAVLPEVSESTEKGIGEAMLAGCKPDTCLYSLLAAVAPTSADFRRVVMANIDC